MGNNNLHSASKIAWTEVGSYSGGGSQPTFFSMPKIFHPLEEISTAHEIMEWGVGDLMILRDTWDRSAVRIMIDPVLTAEDLKLSGAEEPKMMTLNKEERLAKARELMRTIPPKKMKLQMGRMTRITENLFAEKSKDGKITLYEVEE